MCDEFGDLFREPTPAATATPQTAVGDAVFDIETGPEPTATLEALFDFDPAKIAESKLIGATFDPASVKVGNMKDQTKIDAKIQSEREKFEAAVAGAEAAVAKAREDAWLAFVERAALSPFTGRVLAIGYACGGRVELDWGTEPGGNGAEHGLLVRFWSHFKSHLHNGTHLVGHNIYGFDLPFLVRRSWLLKVEIPPEAFSFTGGRWQWNRLFVDTMTALGCGIYGERIGLDRAAQFFDTQRKLDGVTGADFHRLFNGTPKERTKALDYLAADLKATADVARRIGVL